MSVLWRFTPLDTLFFRDGQPFNAGETVWLESLFPPSGRTLQGVIRSAIVEYSGMDWKTYHNVCKTPDDNPLVKAIGNAETLGNMRLSGPFLMRDDDWLFPVPLDLFHAKQGYGLLAPSATLVECDLGKIHLPAGKGEGLKIQEGKYVTSQAMVDLLAGRTTALPSIWKLFADDPKEGDALADLEPKVGLERDNALRKHKEGRLYSIALVRLREHVQLAVAVSGLPRDLQPTGPLIQRLGGEGKLAQVIIGELPSWPIMPRLVAKDGKFRFKLVLTTPAYFKECWRPDGFVREIGQGWRGTLRASTTAHGTLELTGVTIIFACIGKTVRIGGWNLMYDKPRSLEGFVPAGSVYFCEVDAGTAQ
jgi:CRISPR-associated protein Cmr3